MTASPVSRAQRADADLQVARGSTLDVRRLSRSPLSEPRAVGNERVGEQLRVGDAIGREGARARRKRARTRGSTARASGAGPTVTAGRIGSRHRRSARAAARGRSRRRPQRRERARLRGHEVHPHFGAPAREVAELDRRWASARITGSPMPPSILARDRARGAGCPTPWSRTTTSSPSAGDVDLHLERPFLAFVGVEHDVVARLADRGADVVELDRIEPDRLRQRRSAPGGRAGRSRPCWRG